MLPAKAAEESAAPAEWVVLLHGLAAPSAMMIPLARRLARAGFRVVNWSYPSTRYTVEVHAARLAELLRELHANPRCETFHLVGHSLGGIVARAAWNMVGPLKPARMVMLAPPNHGSPLARTFGPLLARLWPALTQLEDRPTSFVNRLLKPQGIEVGVIAARRDILVPLPSTHLDGQVDHLVVPGLHTLIVFRRDVADQIVHFLRTGRFAALSMTTAGAARR